MSVGRVYCLVSSLVASLQSRAVRAAEEDAIAFYPRPGGKWPEEGARAEREREILPRAMVEERPRVSWPAPLAYSCPFIPCQAA